jgi:hypothetical protein
VPQFHAFNTNTIPSLNLALIRPDDVPSSVQDEPRMTSTALVTADFFNVFNLPAQIGRTFTTADDQSGAAPVAVLSHAFWRSRLAGDPQVIGRAIRVGEQPYTTPTQGSPE